MLRYYILFFAFGVAITLAWIHFMLKSEADTAITNFNPMHQTAVATAFLHGTGLICKPNHVEFMRVGSDQYTVTFTPITNDTVPNLNESSPLSPTKISITDSAIQFTEHQLKTNTLSTKATAIEQAVIFATTLIATKGIDYERYDIYPSINEKGDVAVVFQRIPHALGEHCLVFQRHGKAFFNAGR